jgi:Pentapeptide repeats (8 copies)
VDSSAVGYDGGQNVIEEERPVGRKKPGRKAEPEAKRGLTWPEWTGFRGKTVWDLLQLLIVPLALVVIGFLFSAQQDARQQKIENQRAQQAQKIENQRAEAERELAALRTEQATLQAYLDQMTTLLLDRNLREADENSDVRMLARGRTLVVLDALSEYRQVRALRFLYEAKLIQPTSTAEQPVISLNNASLNNLKLSRRPFLGGAELQQAGLSGAKLSHSDLRETHLVAAELQGTNLEHADLEGADLSAAFLGRADLSGANLADADLSNAEGLYEKGTNLWKRGAGLIHANLEGANLEGANLEGANVTSEQLDQAKSLVGATMPNGQKYEDWLESKGRGEDGENGGPS